MSCHFHPLCIDHFLFSNLWNPKSQILVKHSWVMEPSNWVTGFALALSKKIQSESKISPPPSHIHTVCKKYHISLVWPSWINAMSMNRTNKTCRWWRLADVVHTAGGVRRKKFNIWPSRQQNNTSTHGSDLLCCPFLAFTFLFTPRDVEVKYIKAILETGKLEINKGLSIYYHFLQYYRGGGGGGLPGPQICIT